MRDLATAPARGITQPRTNLIREPCILHSFPVLWFLLLLQHVPQVVHQECYVLVYWQFEPMNDRLHPGNLGPDSVGEKILTKILPKVLEVNINLKRINFLFLQVSSFFIVNF